VSRDIRLQVRWLFRSLCEPTFLRLYVEENEPFPLRVLEQAFWGLAGDGERPDSVRAAAWNALAQWAEPAYDPMARGAAAPGSVPIDWFVRIVKGLRERMQTPVWSEAVGDLARFWCLTELFPDTRSSQQPPEPDEPPYHEIHCHFRGAAPFPYLWHGWLVNEHWRAQLNREICRAAPWEETWAKLVNKASEVERLLPDNLRVSAMGPRPDSRDVEQRLRDIAELAIQEETALEQRAAAARYLAICTGLRGYLIHQRGQTGLTPFTTSYRRYSTVQKRGGNQDSNANQKQVVAILQQFEREQAATIELRPTLERRRGDLESKLGDLVRGYFAYLLDWMARMGERSEVPVLMGLVPSLFKQENPADDAARDADHAASWQQQADLWLRQVEMLLSVLQEVPALRYFVVGIDAAGKERGCPPRVLAPAYKLIRDYNQTHGLVLAAPGRRMSVSFLRSLVEGALEDRSHRRVLDERVPQMAFEALNRVSVLRIRLGITIHAGEDFEDPHTGLRHIWESLEALDLSEGDRIGHALAAALTEDALTSWLQRHDAGGPVIARRDDNAFRVQKPRGTHLLDLAWIRRMMDGHTGHFETTGAMLAHAMSDAFGNPASPTRIATALSHGGAVVAPLLPAVRFDDPCHVAPEDRVLVTWDGTWRERFDRLRERVITAIVRRGVVVESCPSSNMVVANLDHPPLQDLVKHPRLRCAIATDDPGLLGAWPQDEFARFDNETRVRLLRETARASFVQRADADDETRT
jgi:hypothetical protein